MNIGILWDLDGTLLDTLADLADAVNFALTQKGYPERSYKEVRDFVGNGALNLMRRSVPEGTGEEDVLDTLQIFRDYYQDHAMVKTGPYAGVGEVLQEISKKYPCAIVSNKPDEAVKALCARFFPGIQAVGERAGVPRKPAPDMVQKAMAELGVETCIYIGDSEVDVLTARNAAVPCLSVLWGFRDEEVLADAGATHLCREPSALLSMIEEIIKEFF